VQTQANNPAEEAKMSYLIIVVPATCLLLGWLTLLTLGGREPGSPPPEDYLPKACRRKKPDRRKTKTK